MGRKIARIVAVFLAVVFRGVGIGLGLSMGAFLIYDGTEMFRQSNLIDLFIVLGLLLSCGILIATIIWAFTYRIFRASA